MRIQCPAKINLDLRVGPPRTDGFHPIRSWFVTVGLYDTLTLSPADDLSLTCDDPAVPSDARNLVWRAAEALRPAGRGVAITLSKRIPSGGGLGGGSSDAASALVRLDAFWELGRSRDELATIAATLGSDVPFFLYPPSAICRGRGEVIEPVPPPNSRWAVLVLPPIHMPTPAVFRRLDELRPTAAFDDETPQPTATTAAELLPTLVNDLEAPAFDLSPELAGMRGTLERRLDRPVRMSGSGSTLFTLYDAESEARAAALTLAGMGRVEAVPVAPPSGGASA